MEIVEKVSEEEVISERNKHIIAEENMNAEAKEGFYGADDTVTLEGRSPGFYEDATPVTEDVRLKDVSKFIAERVRESAQDGNVPATIRRYTEQLKSVVMPDKHLELRRVTERIWNERYNEEAVERGRREFIDLIAGLKVQRRTDNGK